MGQQTSDKFLTKYGVRGEELEANALSKNSLLVSVLAIVFSITVIALKGLNFGIDFTGGTNIRFPLTEWVTSTQVMEALDSEEIRRLELDFGPPQPYNYVDSQTGRQRYGVLITSRFMNEQEQTAVISALEAAFGVSADESALQINQVEPIIGKELLLNAFTPC